MSTIILKFTLRLLFLVMTGSSISIEDITSYCSLFNNKAGKDIEGPFISDHHLNLVALRNALHNDLTSGLIWACVCHVLCGVLTKSLWGWTSFIAIHKNECSLQTCGAKRWIVHYSSCPWTITPYSKARPQYHEADRPQVCGGAVVPGNQGQSEIERMKSKKKNKK